MKSLAIILVCALGLLACRKEDLSNYRARFLGKWEYVTFNGYPFTTTPLPPGNGNIIAIGPNDSFERRLHDSLLFRGKFMLEEKKDCTGEEKKIFFKTTDSLFIHDDVISVKGDSLYLSTPNCYADGGVQSTGDSKTDLPASILPPAALAASCPFPCTVNGVLPGRALPRPKSIPDC